MGKTTRSEAGRPRQVLELRNGNGPWGAAILLTLSSRRAVRFSRASKRKSAQASASLMSDVSTMECGTRLQYPPTRPPRSIFPRNKREE